MAARTFNGWVESDVAIEIIGKMIAEESRRLDDLLVAYENSYIDEDDELVQNDETYRESIAKLDAFNREIESIHSGVDLETIFERVHLVYAPHIRDRQNSLVSY